MASRSSDAGHAVNDNTSDKTGPTTEIDLGNNTPKDDIGTSGKNHDDTVELLKQILVVNRDILEMLRSTATAPPSSPSEQNDMEEDDDLSCTCITDNNLIERALDIFDPTGPKLAVGLRLLQRLLRPFWYCDRSYHSVEVNLMHKFRGLFDGMSLYVDPDHVLCLNASGFNGPYLLKKVTRQEDGGLGLDPAEDPSKPIDLNDFQQTFEYYWPFNMWDGTERQSRHAVDHDQETDFELGAETEEFGVSWMRAKVYLKFESHSHPPSTNNTNDYSSWNIDWSRYWLGGDEVFSSTRRSQLTARRLSGDHSKLHKRGHLW